MGYPPSSSIIVGLTESDFGGAAARFILEKKLVVELLLPLPFLIAAFGVGVLAFVADERLNAGLGGIDAILVGEVGYAHAPPSLSIGEALLMSGVGASGGVSNCISREYAGDGNGNPDPEDD